MPNLGFCEFSVRFCEINFEQKYLKKVVKLKLGKAKQYSIKICQNIKSFYNENSNFLMSSQQRIT